MTYFSFAIGVSVGAVGCVVVRLLGLVHDLWRAQQPVSAAWRVEQAYDKQGDDDWK